MTFHELSNNNPKSTKELRNIVDDNDELYRTVSAQVSSTPSVVHYVVEQTRKGATVPFLARYRRDETDQMDDEVIRKVIDLTEELQELRRRRAYMLKKLTSRGLLTDELADRFRRLDNLHSLEDAWEVFKERTNLAQRGREAGLAPLATKLLHTTEHVGLLSNRLREVADGNKLFTAIIVEEVKQCCELHEMIHAECKQSSIIHSKIVVRPRKNVAKELSSEAFDRLKRQFSRYDDRRWRPSCIEAHNVLALQRGEDKGVLSVKLIAHNQSKRIFNTWVKQNFIGTRRQRSHGLHALLWRCLDAAYEHAVDTAHNSIRRELKRRSQMDAIAVFSSGLRHILLQCPMREARILAMDPGFKHGVKCVALNENGGLISTFICNIREVKIMKDTISNFVEKLKLNKIAIGNGTASRQVADIVAETIEERELQVEYAIVSEAGASVYSVSDVAKEEFPTLDAMYRGAVSIGRRVIDPLSELVKIPVRSMGIGMYQHDVSEAELLRALHRVVESCVASVGVNVMSSNRYMMEKIPGITKPVVDEIIFARERNALNSREDLRRVKGVTTEIFQQIAGFFRFPNSPNPLDNTNIHPELYSVVQRVIDVFPGKELKEVGLALLSLSNEDSIELASKAECGKSTLSLIANELASPVIDPRLNLPHVGLFRRAPRRVSEMNVGDIIMGVVQNVTTFGTFVDVGLHDDVLVCGLGIETVYPGSVISNLRYEGCDNLGRIKARYIEKTALQGDVPTMCKDSVSVTKDLKSFSTEKSYECQVSNTNGVLLVCEGLRKNNMSPAENKGLTHTESKEKIEIIEGREGRKRVREGDQSSLATNITLPLIERDIQGSKLKRRKTK